jgi:hypothetical protein
MPNTGSCYLLLVSLLIFEVSVAVKIHLMACWVMTEFSRSAFFWDFMQSIMVVLCQTLVQNFHSMLCTIPKECRSHLHHGRVQKSHERVFISIVTTTLLLFYWFPQQKCFIYGHSSPQPLQCDWVLLAFRRIMVPLSGEYKKKEVCSSDKFLFFYQITCCHKANMKQ